MGDSKGQPESVPFTSGSCIRRSLCVLRVSGFGSNGYGKTRRHRNDCYGERSVLDSQIPGNKERVIHGDTYGSTRVSQKPE